MYVYEINKIVCVCGEVLRWAGTCTLADSVYCRGWAGNSNTLLNKTSEFLISMFSWSSALIKGFPGNETFREKNAKIFGPILQSICEISRKCKTIFAKCKNFAKIPEQFQKLFLKIFIFVKF